MTPAVVFLYDHFYPDYSAGGPVTSLYNLAKLLPGTRIITSNRFYDTGKTMEVDADCWTELEQVPVWYASGTAGVQLALRSLDTGSTVYLNGIFSMSFFFNVIKTARRAGHQIVISPRGMLQAGALQHKSLKKKVYLFLLRMLRRLEGVRWHATDAQESEDIKKHFGRASDVTVIPNVPRAPAGATRALTKRPGELRLVYFSLIARKKNLHFLIDVIQSMNHGGVSLDIVGPVKDHDYWKECEKLITPGSVIKYIGDCNPQQVNELLASYHLMALPTLGENFGHAIVESLGSSRPVLISDRTPWNDITPLQGGFVAPLEKQKWVDAVQQGLGWSQSDFDQACDGALRYVHSKVKFDDLRSRYLSLFGVS